MHLRNKTLALFFTTRVSLKKWHEIGMIDREVALYNELSRYFKTIYFFTYGGSKDLEFRSYLADNIKIIPKRGVSSDLLYSLLIPFIHWRVLRGADILRTNQMFGAWSAVIAKIVHRKKLVVRTGNILSLQFANRNPNSRIKWLMRVIEWIVYRFADATISSSQSGFEYVERSYHPCRSHILLPNYVETDIFRPMDITKERGSICFVGKSSPQKNLVALLEALEGLPYSLSIIGAGIQAELLGFAIGKPVKVKFLGNIPNHKLPKILNQHELFVLPSLWEGMPKTLLEAMSCGLPVIGTNIDGIREVIKHGENGVLCDTDSGSIRQAIITLMEKDELKKRLGASARRTIVDSYSLNSLADKELKLMGALMRQTEC